MSLSEINILITGPQHPPLMEALEKTFKVHKLWEVKDKGDFLKTMGPLIQGMVTSFVYGAEAQLINALPNLKIITNYGVGYEKVDVQAAFHRGIKVTNTPDISEPVADLTMTLLLCVARRVCEADRFVRAGKWAQGAFPFSTHIAGKTGGIVGLGRIGKAVAKRAEAFNMKIAYYGPRHKPEIHYPYYKSLKDLARDSDFLVLTLPGGKETHHIIDEEILTALGPKGYLINVARGSVLDEAVLYQALKSGQIAGAGLDVFQEEPLTSSPLMNLENVVLLPHIASATIETRQAMGDVVFENLKAYFSNQPLLTEVRE